MELDKLDPALVYFAHHRPSQTLCREGLSYTRSSLENNVFLVSEDGLYLGIIGACHIDFSQEILARIRVVCCLLLHRILITDDIHNEIILASGELE